MITVTVWRRIPGYAGRYEVSDSGLVRSSWRREPAILQATPNNYGYLRVSLWDGKTARTEAVHRLVLRAFAGPRPPGHEVRHLDGDKLNNALTNLAYGTSAENKADQLAHGTHPQAVKTHCAAGHEFTDENTYRGARGGRQCRVCNRAAAARHRAKKRDRAYV